MGDVVRVDLQSHPIHRSIERMVVIIDVEEVGVEDPHNFLLDWAIHEEER